MSRFFNHPVTLSVCLLSAIITIYVFFSGKSDFYSATHNALIKTDSTTLRSDTFGARAVEHNRVSTKSLSDTSDSSSLRYLFSHSPFADLDTTVIGKRINEKYVNGYFGFQLTLPDVYRFSQMQPAQSEDKVHLFDLEMVLLDKHAPAIQVEARRQAIISRKDQQEFITAFMKHFTGEFYIRVDMDAAYPKSFKIVNFGGQGFYSMKGSHVFEGVLLKQQSYCTFFRGHFITFLSTAATDGQIKAFDEMMSSFTPLKN